MTSFRKRQLQSKLQGNDHSSSHFYLAAEEESVKDRAEQEQQQQEEANTDDPETNEMPLSEFPKAEEIGSSKRIKREDSKLRSLSTRSFNCQGKNLKINIPLTTPTRTFSAITYLVWEDLINQSSRKCNSDGGKLNINKTKLRRAEKMIKGAFVELYKGLGYLETYRYLKF